MTVALSLSLSLPPVMYLWFELAVDSNGVICISSSLNYCNEARTSSEKSLNVSQNSIAQPRLSVSSSETTTPSNHRKDARSEPLDGSQDPYAFDEDAFQPSKWDLLSGKQKISQTRNSRVNSREVENGYQYKLSCQEESSNGENCLQKSSNTEHYHSQKSSHCSVPDEELPSLLADCLLTAIKVFLWTILRIFFCVPYFFSVVEVRKGSCISFFLKKIIFYI